MSLLGFCEWLATTPGSIALHESRYVFLIVLTAHLMAMCVFAGFALMMDLRLLGLTLTHAPASEVVSRLVWWAMAGFLGLIVTGALLFYAAPVDRFENFFFRAKIAMLVLAGVNVWVFHRTVFRSVADWDLNRAPPQSARVAGGLSLLLWAGIIIAGRMIPYQQYWFV